LHSEQAYVKNDLELFAEMDRLITYILTCIVHTEYLPWSPALF